MGAINLKKELSYPANEIWDQIKDFKNIQKILPIIGHADLTSKHNCGEGAERICYMKGMGFDLHEKVTEWKEGEFYTIDIYKTSMPLMKSAVTTLGVRKLTDTTSEVYFRSNYKVKYGLIGKFFDLIMINGMMNIMTGTIFSGIKKQIVANRNLKTDRLLGGV